MGSIVGIFSRLFGGGHPSEGDWPVIVECVTEGLRDIRDQWFAGVLSALPQKPKVEKLIDEAERAIQFFQIASAVQRLQLQGYLRSQNDVRTFGGLLMFSAVGPQIMDFAVYYSKYPHFWETNPESRETTTKQLLKDATDTIAAYLYGSKSNVESPLRTALALAISDLHMRSQVVLALCFRDEKTARGITHDFKAFIERIGQ